MKISVIVTLKKDVLDPQGKVVNQTLKNMGYNNITNVRQGKYFEIEINDSKEKSTMLIEEVCKKLLSNTVKSNLNNEIFSNSISWIKL